jgi:hypothetical protein
MLRVILIVSISMFILSCGGGSGVTQNNTPQYEYSFEGLQLYGFYREFNNHQLRYYSHEILEHNYIDRYFENGGFVQLENDFQIIINSNHRASYSDISYNLNSSGGITASYNAQDIFELVIENKINYSDTKLVEYNFDMELTGTKYSVIKRYKQNFYILKDLTSSDSYANLDAFIANHRSTPFIGSSYRGLVFSHSNKLLELNNGIYSDAGSYAIEIINEKEVLFIYPDNQITYPSNGCYILDFNRVWLSKCYEANQEENLTLYDNSAYQSVEEYLQENLIDVEVNI